MLAEDTLASMNNLIRKVYEPL